MSEAQETLERSEPPRRRIVARPITWIVAVLVALTLLLAILYAAALAERDELAARLADLGEPVDITTLGDDPHPDEEVIEDAGDVRVVFEDPGPRGLARRVLSYERDFADDIEFLNEFIALPEDVVMRFRPAPSEDDVGAYYDPGTGEIHIHYELLEAIDDVLAAHIDYESAEERLAAVRGALEFFAYHELGHALVEGLQLPVTGREEDAVDGLAMVLLIRTYEGTGGQSVALATSDVFDAFARADEGAVAFEDFADEHSLDEQRSVQIVCWVYGTQPDEFGSLVEDGYITPERADRCTEEYNDLVGAWDTLLAGYWK